MAPPAWNADLRPVLPVGGGAALPDRAAPGAAPTGVMVLALGATGHTGRSRTCVAWAV